MSLWRIAWRSIQQRGLASLLTTFSIGLGVMMVVAVLSIHGVVAESFRSNASLGYNIIVGAKGGKLQLTLSSVYYLSPPIENVPYLYYLEFFPEQRRREELRLSLRDGLQQQLWSLQARSLVLTHAATTATGGVSGLAASAALFDHGERAVELARPGRYSLFTAQAIPLCLGDFYGRFRVVGTTPDFFSQLKFGPASDRSYEFAAGRSFQTFNEEHGYFEAVLGATVAHEMHVRVGDELKPTHGDPEGAGHGQGFTVVGILAPTGTPNDRVAFVNMEGFYLMEDHAKPLEEDESANAGSSDAATAESPAAEPSAGAAPAGSAAAPRWPNPLPIEQREVTSILVRTVNPLVSRGLENSINEGRDAQAVLPVAEIYNLFDFIVRPVQQVLVAMTALICVVSGVSMLVSIYNSMNDRRHEIAVMRALGAGRATVMSVILLESLLLTVGGGAIGWVAAHGLNTAASDLIERRTGVRVHFWDLAPEEDLQAMAVDYASIWTELDSTTFEQLGKLAWGAAWCGVILGGVVLLWAGCHLFLWLRGRSSFDRMFSLSISAAALIGMGGWLYEFSDWLMSPELLIIPPLLLGSIVMGLLPAVAAYRTDVAMSLGK